WCGRSYFKAGYARMTFKELLKADIETTFLNKKEFADKHEVEGKIILCMFENESLREKTGVSESAISEAECLLYAKCEDLPIRKGFGSSLIVDGIDYMVLFWDENEGIASISLSIGTG
ncbi:MAG: hypothetical protein PHX08_11650, partial [Lachnospiraceae bacterium]|nr:hypothetical protein [Lachnospiraceae bacterium]